jgi:prevent-host-death family protein
MLRWLFSRVPTGPRAPVELAQFNLYEARQHLSRLVDRVVDGEEVVIARNGRPLVKLVRYDRFELTRPGVVRAELLISPADGREPSTPTRSSTAASS